MFPCMIKTIAAVVFVLSLVTAHERELYSELNPGCSICSKNNTLMYTRAVGAQDTIHQIWDFTKGMPLVILALGEVNSTIKIMWEGVFPTAFTMLEKPKYSFALAFDKLYEYNDIHDNGYIEAYNTTSPRRAIPLSRAEWILQSDAVTADCTTLAMRGFLQDKSRTGVIDVKLDLLPLKGYASELPHLIHTANSTLMEVTLANLTTSSDYNSSRFALHALLTSQDADNDTMRYSMRKSLDDEHTPGVFEIIEVKSPGSACCGAGGFLQFRPVAYVEQQRGVEAATTVRLSAFNRATIPDHSTLRAFYRGFDSRRLLVQQMFVSFGEPGDGFYGHHNYTLWAFTIGYGAPPVEGFSAFVISIIAAGLGVPVVLALSGAVYALVRRSRQRNAPTRLVDEQ